MAHLLDVNVLIALLDPDHTHSHRVSRWFTESASQGWATCAITENAFVRIVSQSSYPHPVSVDEALTCLRQACSAPHHEFWECDLSITDMDRINPNLLLRSSQLTDIYLLSLAVKNSGSLVTLDRRISHTPVVGATDSDLIVL